MFSLDYLIEHAVDKEVYVIQKIMKTLDNNRVSYKEWELILLLLTSLVDEQAGSNHIKYRGE